ncbi:unnamed protein product [Toxocara canis]|uniref:Acetyltransferase n=1 Tax=Toxocara canis TaxID=6265 RepID=A0A183V0F3_TOXCA|nr:unnamed protein product [Toxocara canis]
MSSAARETKVSVKIHPLTADDVRIRSDPHCAVGDSLSNTPNGAAKTPDDEPCVHQLTSPFMAMYAPRYPLR